MSSPRTQTLYRPVGLRELELILDARARAFPPRLPDQPIFYPVLNYEYAEQIARDWNTPEERSGFAGFATRFEVDADYLQAFEVKVVGASRHQELWVPAERLPEFNQHLVSLIQVETAWYGPAYEGPHPVSALLKATRPAQQLEELVGLRERDAAIFERCILEEWQLVFCNHGLWRTICERRHERNMEAGGIEATLAALAEVWRASPHAGLLLPEVRGPRPA